MKREADKRDDTAAAPAVKKVVKKQGKAGAPVGKNTGKMPVPPCPPEDPMAGDKTPAVIAWWFRYHPAEAEERYAGRKFERPQEPNGSV